MNEELKRRAEEEMHRFRLHPVGVLIRDLLAECERLETCYDMKHAETELAFARIAELEQSAPEPCCCNPSRCTRACTPRGEWIERQRAEQPKINQCAETCERAKMCAICAGPITEQPKPEPAAWRKLLHAAFHLLDDSEEDAGTGLLSIDNQIGQHDLRAMYEALDELGVDSHEDIDRVIRAAPPAMPEPKPQPARYCPHNNDAPCKPAYCHKCPLLHAAPPAIPSGYALVPENATPYQVEAMTVMAETMLSAVGKLDVALIYGTGIEAVKVQQP